MKALEKDRTRRYDSPGELAADIGRHLRDEPVLAGPPSATYRVKKFVRRHTIGVAASALVVLALILGIAGTTVGLVRARKAEARGQPGGGDRAADLGLPDGALRGLRSERGEGRDHHRPGDPRRGCRDDRERAGGSAAGPGPADGHHGSGVSKLGLYDEARPLIENGLAIREQSLGPESEEVAQSLEVFGGLLETAGDLDKAEEILERALAIQEKNHGPEDPAVAAASSNNLAKTLDAAGEYERAKLLYERAIEVWEKVSGPDHMNVTPVLNNMGLVLYNMGDYEGARALYERGLSIMERALGPDHPDIAHTLHNLGMLAAELGEREEARRYFERTLAITERVLGPDHPDVAGTVRSLAIHHATGGDLEKALPLFQRVLAVNKKALGPDHATVGSDVSNIGHAESSYGQVRNGAAVLDAVWRSRRRLSGPSIPCFPTTSEPSPDSIVKRAIRPRLYHSSSAPWRFVRKLWGRSIPE